MKDLFSSLKTRLLGGGGATSLRFTREQIIQRGGIA